MSSGNEQFEREFEAFLREEDSRVAALYRKLPQPEPDARLDAAVHAMAHRALNPQLVATPRPESRRRRGGHWLPAFGSAAGVVLAAGIALKLGPNTRSDRNEAGAPASDVITVHQLDAPPPVAPPLSPPPPAKTSGGSLGGRSLAPKPATEKVAALPAPVPEQPEKAPGTPAAEIDGSASGDLKKAEKADATAAQAQPFPAPSRQRHRTVDAEKRLQEIAAGRWEDPYDRKLDEAARAAAKRSNAEPAQPGATAPPAASLQYAPAPSGFAASPAPPIPAERAKSAVANAPENRSVGEAATAEAKSAGNALADEAHVTRSSPRDASVAGLPAAARQSAQSDKLDKDVSTEPAPNATAAAAGGLHRETSAAPGEEAEAKQRSRSNDPNAKLYPEHWLVNIRTMLHEHRRAEALRSLGEFRRMYPDYRLPDDLRDLK